MFWRARRIALIATLVALVPVAFSYVTTMLGRSNSSLSVRSVEWLRDHGAAGIVAAAESEYYTLTAPSQGGPTLHALPAVGYSAGAVRPRSRRLYVPRRVAALFSPALPGEGVWRAIRRSLRARPPVLVTTLRDQPDYPRVVAGLAWIDPRRTVITLNPGLLEPSVALPDRGLMEVPPSSRGGLLATFNSGFKLSDDHAGFALNGHAYAPLRDGQATIVGYRDGLVDVVDWTGGHNVPSSVAFARQNLPLIVADGQVSPAVGDSSLWGATVGNAILVWRSGIGVDRHGNLIYAAGDYQTVRSLARTLARAGAMRAMELDINSYWVSFITYGAAGARDPANLLPNMDRSDLRYLTPDDRDFFAVYAR